MSNLWMQQAYWYHGTTSAFFDGFEHVSASKSRTNRDFGNGFYLTPSKLQAVNWAKRKSSITNSAALDVLVRPMVVTCWLSLSTIASIFSILRLGPSISPEYLDYLVFNRIERGQSGSFDRYDLVYGLIADGRKLDDTIKKYQRGDITFEKAKQLIAYRERQMQICVKSQLIIDSPFFTVTTKELI